MDMSSFSFAGHGIGDEMKASWFSDDSHSLCIRDFPARKISLYYLRDVMSFSSSQIASQDMA